MSDRKAPEGRKRSAAAIAASEKWADSKIQRKNTEYLEGSREFPIEIDHDLKIQRNNKENKYESKRTSPIRLLYNSSFEMINDETSQNSNRDTLKLSEIVGKPDMITTYQFNFAVDLEFFLENLSTNMAKRDRKIIFVTGSKLLDPEKVDYDFISKRFDIEDFQAPLPRRYGTHHTKMMINFFEDGTVEVVILTCNLQRIDFAGLTQMCWTSQRLSQGATSSEYGNNFKRDLIRYLRRYKISRITELANKLDHFNFLLVNVELVASAPGLYDMKSMTDSSEIYGYGKLFQVLRRNNLLLENSSGHGKYNILAQVSSIAYPISLKNGHTASIFTHLLCPLICGSSTKLFDVLGPGASSLKRHQHEFNYEPYIVYPSSRDISKGNLGFYSGQAIHFNYSSTKTHKRQLEENIRPYLYRWCPESNLDVTGREKVPPHVKLYMCDNADNWASLKWVLMGSHNLSKLAWGGKDSFGYSNSDPSKYLVASYELGILIAPSNPNEKLVPVYKRDTLDEGVDTTSCIPIRLPFRLPPERYISTEEPWSALRSFGPNLKDRFGQSYLGIE